MSTLAPLIVEEVPEIKEKKEREKPVRVRYIGVINSVRKVQTKTGKMMAIGMCESTDFRFSVVIFPKDYETLGGLLEDNKIILVEGNLKCDLSTGEISVVAQAIKANTITSMRTQAQEMGLFDASQRVYSSVPLDDDPSSRDLLPLPVSPLELTIPALASKQDLLDLKTYLQGLSGNIPVRIFLSGNSIDTKLCIGSRSELESWAKTRWGDSRIREILPTT